METTTGFRVYGLLYRGYIGIMENTMEATLVH